jgi:hypothetical protein
MPEENLSPQEDQTPEQQPMATFADLEKIAEESRKAGEGQDEGSIEDKGSQDNEGAQVPPQGADKDEFSAKLEKHGFKSTEDLLKSYENAHAKITQLSQSSAETKRQLDALGYQYNQILQVMEQASKQGQVPPANQELFAEVAPLVEQMVNQKIGQVQAAIDFKANKDAALSKRSKNPEEFDELLPIMTEVIRRNPHLNSADQLDTVYETAKQVRTQQIGKLLSTAFGPNVDMDKVRKFFSKDGTPEQSQQPANQDSLRAAHIPPSQGGSGKLPEGKNDYSSEIRKARDLGDVDNVVKLTLKRAGMIK